MTDHQRWVVVVFMVAGFALGVGIGRATAPVSRGVPAAIVDRMREHADQTQRTVFEAWQRTYRQLGHVCPELAVPPASVHQSNAKPLTGPDDLLRYNRCAEAGALQ